MRLPIALSLAASLTTLAPSPLRSQRLPEPPPRVRGPATFTTYQAPQLTRAGDVGTSAVMTAGYAVGGLLAGLWISERFTCTSLESIERCDRWKGATGAVLGGATLGAVGAHLGNRAGGRLPVVMAATVGTAAVTLALARARDDTEILLPSAAIPFVAAVATEHLTTRPRAPLPPADVVASLPAWQVEQEARPRYASAYGLGGALLGAAVGAYAGGVFGYHLSYARDIQHGCEDCGVTGAILGVAIGGGIGGATGGVLGAVHGHRIDLAEAAARILARRGPD